ncbi:MAG: carboxymuconolactone decarboxylase family protein [Gammaproteobacteria bacterium]
MPRIKSLSPDQADNSAQPFLAAVSKQMGTIPNIFATMAHAPAVLEGFMGFSGALGKGKLDPVLREQIALVVAGYNGCDYCASAHTALGLSAGLSKQEILQNLVGTSSDQKTADVLSFVRLLMRDRGRVRDSEIEHLRAHRLTDEELIEIVAHVAVNTFTNYFNHLAETEIDFPVIKTEGVSRAA